MLSSRKAAHIGTNFSQQRRGGNLLDPWNAGQDGHRRFKLLGFLLNRLLNLLFGVLLTLQDDQVKSLETVADVHS